MIHRYALMLVLVPIMGYAAADAPGSECAVRGHYGEEMLLSAVTKDGVKAIERDKTSVEVLGLSPVSDTLARQYAQADAKAGSGLTVKDYYGIYHDNGAMALTTKYTYRNAKGASNVYIVSSLLNNDECSVRFNGYLTLSREF
ncbi:MAG TPA: Shiga toxin A subunit [Scandinavium sp.]|jgi:hypothetical protein